MLRPLNTKPSAPLKNGFTLIELGVVLMVMGMMATSVVPGLIAQTRDKLADRVVRDFQHLNNAALLFRADPLNSRWPGYDDACLVNDTQWFEELEDAGYIPNIDAAPSDPWGGDYHFKVVASTCLATITSANTIPESVHTYIVNTSSIATECNATDNCTYKVGAGGNGNTSAPEEGTIVMFDDRECPAGWEEHDSLNDGRFPRGMTGEVNRGQTGGTQSITMQYEFWALSDASDSSSTTTAPDPMASRIQWTPGSVALMDDDVFQERRYLKEFGMEVTDTGNSWDSREYNNWSNSGLIDAGNTLDITPSYTNVLYCKYNP
jgi:general secretion pathway protein G